MKVWVERGHREKCLWMTQLRERALVQGEKSITFCKQQFGLLNAISTPLFVTWHLILNVLANNYFPLLSILSAH